MKKTYIEFLRIAACFLVIVNHTNSRIFMERTPGAVWGCSAAAFLVSKIAVALFLMIMGALLLGREDSPKKSAQRVLRAAGTLAVFTLLYHVYFAWRFGSAFSLKHALWQLPQTPASNALWYLYLYLGMMLSLPLLQKLVRALDRRGLQYLLLLSVGLRGAALLVPGFHLNGYFSSALIGTHVGQAVLGYYIERHVPVTRRTFRACLAGLAGLAALQLALALVFYARDGAEFYQALENSELITTSAMAACVYVCVRYLFAAHPVPERSRRAVCALGGLTFGIYLFGDMAINFTEPAYNWLSQRLPALCAMALWELLIFTLAALVTAALRCVPWVRKWI